MVDTTRVRCSHGQPQGARLPSGRVRMAAVGGPRRHLFVTHAVGLGSAPLPELPCQLSAVAARLSSSSVSSVSAAGLRLCSWLAVAPGTVALTVALLLASGVITGPSPLFALAGGGSWPISVQRGREGG